MRFAMLAVRTHPLYGCHDKVADVFAPAREGIVAQEMGGPGGPWALVGTLPRAKPRILGWVAA